MKKRTIAWIIALVFVIGAAVISYSLLSLSADQQGAGGGGTAPDFLIYDKDGNEITLADFEGKPVVINFWASWCDPCKSEMEGFDNKCKEYGDKADIRRALDTLRRG